MSAIGTIGLLAAGYAAGAVSMLTAVLTGQRLRSNREQEDAHEQAKQFMFWADEREFNDRRVCENRRQAANNPHGLAVVRADFDQQHDTEGGKSW